MSDQGIWISGSNLFRWCQGIKQSSSNISGKSHFCSWCAGKITCIIWIAIICFEWKSAIVRENIKHFLLRVIKNSYSSTGASTITFPSKRLVSIAIVVCFYCGAYSKSSIRCIRSIYYFRTRHVCRICGATQNRIASSVVWLAQLLNVLITALRMVSAAPWATDNVLVQIIKPGCICAICDIEIFLVYSIPSNS